MARRTKRRKIPEGRTNVIKDMIEMYDIRTAEDIQEALKMVKPFDDDLYDLTKVISI